MNKKNLLIVESPGKIKTLRKILGPEFRIEASIGHTNELSFTGPKRLGFEFKEGKVITHYSLRKERGSAVVSKLKEAASSCDEVYLASDPDREGEAISWHLVRELGLNSKTKKYHRICFTEITPAAVKKALSQPRELNFPLIDAQRARQCLDKLVGFEVSPLLWGSTGGKSAGRVQSATLHILCEREREREKFIAKDYWVLKSKYTEDGKKIEATYQSEKTPKPENPHHVDSLVEAERIQKIAKENPHFVDSCEQKQENRNPPPPLITSSLQQVAGVKLKFSPKHTMKIAQQLYEGVDGKGLITYMRTDSTALSQDFVDECRKYLKENHAELLPEKPPFYKLKDSAQGAHEAIRPTSAFVTPEKAKSFLNKDQQALYDLIWSRAVACQAKSARISKTKLQIRAADTLWESVGTTILEQGYLFFWKNLEEEHVLPLFEKGKKLDCDEVKVEKRVTEPPPRYSEPRLVQTMERKGIGRPSTYASTIATLKDRDYVVLEKSTLIPTALGMQSDEVLFKSIPELTDTDFTAEMEKSLDLIEEGKKTWDDYLISWANGFLEPAVKKARELLGVKETPVFSGKFSGKSGSLDSETLKKLNEKRDKLFLKAQKNKSQPICILGHGPMVLRTSKSKKVYWKCMTPACEQFAWYIDYSTQKCPVCEMKMEKVPSRKVEGGHFLKCKNNHPEALLFKDRKTKEWVRVEPKKK